MPLPTPILDDRSYQQLRDELVRRIPVYAPEWTDHNASDPGITLVELFAFLGENLLYRFNQIPDTAKLQFLKLLQIPLRAAVPSHALVALTTDDLGGIAADLRTEVKSGKLSFETQTEVVTWPIALVGMARLTSAKPASGSEAETFTNQAIDALLQKAQEGHQPVPTVDPAFYTAQLLPDDPAAPGVTAVDFGPSVDGMLWIAVVKNPSVDAAKQVTLGANLLGAAINVGFVPDEQILTINQVDPCPGEPPSSSGATRPMVWQISTGGFAGDGSPTYRELVPIGDSTRGLSCPGVVRLRLPSQAGTFGNFSLTDPDLVGTGDLPPPIENKDLAARVLFWLRAFRRDGSSLGRLLWVGANGAEVNQTKTANPEFLGTGNAQPDQIFRLVNQNVVAGSAVVEVEGADGWIPWTEVDGFQASGEGDKVFVLDAEAGIVRFGNGVRGMAPQIGERVRATTYRYGGGRAGNVPAKAIDKIVGVAKVKIANPLAARGGADAETIEAALSRIPGEFRRHDRAVAASDFQELALQTPGADVGRAEVLPRFHPRFPGVEAAGVVSVVVWPAEDRKRPDAPMPDKTMLQTVCHWLDPRRLVTTELYVIPPTYRKIAVAVGLEAKDGYGIEAVRRWVELAVRQFLAPLPPYGPTGKGWPLGRKVYGPEIEAAALQVEGVDFLYQVNLAWFNPATGAWVSAKPPPGNDVCLPQTVDLQPHEVVELAELTVVQGAPLDAGTPVTPPPKTQKPVPIPTLKVEC